jgi:arylsulfatase A-like enzyme
MSVSRRHFFLGSLSLPAFAAHKAPPARPNVLLFLVDELPAWILGSYGNKEVVTHNLDRLAQTGTRFMNHFACAPAPTAGVNTLLTGRTPMQLGGTGELSPADVTLDKILGAAGYVCEATDHNKGSEFLGKQSAGKPFFLTTKFTIRYEGVAQKYYDMYASVNFDQYAPDPIPPGALHKEMLSDIIGNARKVAAAVTALDDEVAALLAQLHKTGLFDNTLLIFTSGCGALVGRHGLWGSGLGSDPPNMYDEAAATPMFWSWPGRVPALGSRPEMVSAYDFVPTICDLLGADLPARNLCGRSYGPIVTGKPLPKKHPWRTMVCGHLQNTDMAREERYKVVVRDGGKGPNELYDLPADPREHVNEYDNERYLTIRTTLSAEISKWKQQYST